MSIDRKQPAVANSSNYNAPSSPSLQGSTVGPPHWVEPQAVRTGRRRIELLFRFPSRERSFELGQPPLIKRRDPQECLSGLGNDAESAVALPGTSKAVTVVTSLAPDPGGGNTPTVQASYPLPAASATVVESPVLESRVKITWLHFLWRRRPACPKYAGGTPAPQEQDHQLIV